MFIDDLIIMDNCISKTSKSVSVIRELATNLGFQLNKEKSVLEPTQRIKHLGFIANRKTLCLELPKDKCLDLERKCKQILFTKEPTTIIQVASVVRSLIASSTASK